MADAAGVSVTTASFALSGPPPGRRPPAVETQRRVEEVAAQLGYAPNRSARAMRTSRVQSIVLCTASIHDYWGTELATQVRDRADEHGLATLMLVDSHWYGALRGDTSVCAFITGGGFTDEDRDQVRNLSSQGVRIVLQSGEHEDLGTDEVISSPIDSVALAYQRLRSRHEVVGFVTPAAGTYRGVASPRHQAFIDAALANGDEVSAGSGFAAQPSLRGTALAAEAWLTGPDAVSALVCHNATVAAGVGLGARALGVRVPEQLELVTLGDVVGDAAVLGPTSTYAPPDGVEQIADMIIERALAPADLPPRLLQLDWEYLPGVTTRDGLPCPHTPACPH